MNQIVRLLEIDKRIKAGHYPNAETLASELEVTPRLIYRDRHKLKQMGAPIKWHPQRRGWYYAQPTWSLTTAWLNEGELLAFFLSIEIARSSGNAGLTAALESAVDKLTGSLGTIVSVDVTALRTSTTYAHSPAARVEAMAYLELHRAAAAREKVTMRYFTASSGQTSQRKVHPYHLHFCRGDWYLFGFDESRSAVRNFNIARIDHLQRHHDQHFERDPTFDVSEHIRKMFFAEAGEETFEVVVRFDEYQARYIRERTWHSDQKIEELPGGELLLRFPASGLQEVARWVMGYGSHARVIGPKKLFSLLQSHLDKMMRIYNVTPDSNP